MSRAAANQRCRAGAAHSLSHVTLMAVLWNCWNEWVKWIWAGSRTNE